jgi:RimJ/RimL family protein N-acetyltransferase
METPVQNSDSILERIETARLVLRRWSADDAPRLKTLVDANLDHLRPWMPWAMQEPSPVETIAERLERFARHHRDGLEWTMGIFLGADDTLIGGAGLHPRIGPAALEIGYWIAEPHTRRGYATEAAAALTAAAFAMRQIEHVEIRCDPRNVASARVPDKLGYRHTETLTANTVTPTGEPRDTMVWTITSAEHGGQNIPGGRELLRHMLAVIAYRANKTFHDAPPDFAAFRVGPGSRTPGEIVAHLGDLIEWVESQARGAQKWSDSKPGDWEEDVARFHAALAHLDDYLASGARLGTSAERILSGGIADSLTHVGQLAMLRRLAGSPVRGENYSRAEIVAGRVGRDQAPPRAEFGAG